MKMFKKDYWKVEIMNLYNVRNELNEGNSITSIYLRVTYYSRVSTDHIEQLNSLKNQKFYLPIPKL